MNHVTAAPRGQGVRRLDADQRRCQVEGRGSSPNRPAGNGGEFTPGGRFMAGTLRR